MSANILDKLAALDRPEKEIVVTSRDGERELKLIYIRPTLLQDQILQKQLQEEYENVVRGLKAAPDKEDEQSVYDKLVSQFVQLGIETPINYIVRKDLFNIRSNVLREQSITAPTPLKDDASQEEKDKYAADEAEFMEVFKPAFDKAVDEAKASLRENNDLQDLAERAATLEIEERAMRRALEIHRRNLVAQAIYYRDEEKKDARPEIVFKSADQVAEVLPEDTVLNISSLVSDELEKQRSLPFRSAGKK